MLLNRAHGMLNEIAAVKFDHQIIALSQTKSQIIKVIRVHSLTSNNDIVSQQNNSLVTDLNIAISLF